MKASGKMAEKSIAQIYRMTHNNYIELLFVVSFHGSSGVS